MVDFVKLNSMSSLSKEERKAALIAKSKQLLAERVQKEKEYAEFISDARLSPKLNEWQEKLINELFQAFNRKLITTFSELSERQQMVVKKLRAKIYKIG